jgi:WD40 repeat protein
LLVLRGQTGTVSSAVYLPSGAQVVTASGDRTAAVWDVARPDVDPVELEAELDDGGGEVGIVRAVAFSPDGALLATGSEHATRLWRWQEGAPPVVISGTGARILDVAFSPDGSSLATAASDDPVARVWDVLQPTDPPHELRSHQRTVHSVAFSPEGSFLATTSYDGTAKVWGWPDPGDVELGTYNHNGPEAIDVAVNRDDVHVATTTIDGTAAVWDARNTSETVATFHQPGQVITVAFSPDGTLLATAGNDHVTRIWEWRRRGTAPVELRGHNGSVLGVAFSPDGTQVATASTDGTVRIWDTRTPRARPLVLRHPVGVASLAFAPDGRHLVTGSDDSIARVWDCQECAPIDEVVRLARSRVARTMTAEERAHYLD